jgi:hypothetical protein
MDFRDNPAILKLRPLNGLSGCGIVRAKSAAQARRKLPEEP